MRIRGWWLVVALLVCQSAYLWAHFPTLEQYFPAADEGTFFRGGATILDHGFAGFDRLAKGFLSDPAQQVSPPPTRIGHLLLSAAALSIDRSFRALSVLSLTSHVLVVLVTYLFVRRWCDDWVAACAAVLVAVSPLGSGLATRALSDSEYRLFAVLAAFLSIQWAIDGRWKTGVWALVALAWSAIVKEMTFMLLPAFAAVIATGSIRRRGRLEWQPLAALALVPVAALIVYAAVFGVSTTVSLITITGRMNTFETNEYLRLYHDGPWFTFFVNGLLLAPVTTLAFLLLCGWYLARREPGGPVVPVFVFIVTGLAVFACLPQNPRYSNPLELLMRVFIALVLPAAAAVVPVVRRQALVAGVIALLAVTDIAAFHRLFITNAIYDPIAANLLAARKLVPSVPPQTTPTAGDYLAKSLAYYRAGDFEASIAMARRTIEVGGEIAEAYNNIGAAYCELGRWSDAIPPLQTALRLTPGSALVRNNLIWAQTELQKASAAPPR